MRSLIRRVILTRPVTDAVELKIAWISGAYSELTTHPAVQRTADLADFDRLIARLAEPSAAGHDDREIALRIGAEGFRGARSARLSADMVGKLRRANGVPSLRTQLRQQARFEGQWTTAGLARHLDVPRRWLDARIIGGTLPARQHPLTGHYLIVDDPDLLASLRNSFATQHPADRSR